MTASMRLALLALLLSFACVTARQGSAVDEIFSAFDKEEPAPIPREVDLAYYEEGTELCFREAAVCTKIDSSLTDPDDYFVSEIDCCAGRSRDEIMVGHQQQQPAGLCVFSNARIKLNTPSSDTDIDGVFTATCYLGKDSKDCDLKGLEHTVIPIQGVAVESKTVVFDEDPLKYPLVKCNGQISTPDRRLSRSNGTETDPRRARKAEQRRQQRKAKTPQAPGVAKAPKQAPLSGEATFWEAPALIFSGVANANKRNSPGNLQTGFFEVVRPFISNSDEDIRPITAAEVGNRRVYTPFLYRFNMAPVKSKQQYT